MLLTQIRGEPVNGLQMIPSAMVIRDSTGPVGAE